MSRSKRIALPSEYDAFIFMKVGNHAKETFEQILERKNRELTDAGRIFWGYGGTACHPLQQVQPFARSIVERGGRPYLLMEEIDSRADPEVVPATEFSSDGVSWSPLPAGVSVTGSRYALVLEKIEPGSFLLDTSDFQVGIGPSRGRVATQYLQGRVDKGCLTRETTRAIQHESAARNVDYVATLKPPYAVLLR